MSLEVVVWLRLILKLTPRAASGLCTAHKASPESCCQVFCRHCVMHTPAVPILEELNMSNTLRRPRGGVPYYYPL